MPWKLMAWRKKNNVTYFDTQVAIKDNKIDTFIYRKPTSTGVLMNFMFEEIGVKIHTGLPPGQEKSRNTKKMSKGRKS